MSVQHTLASDNSHAPPSDVVVSDLALPQTGPSPADAASVTPTLAAAVPVVPPPAATVCATTVGDTAAIAAQDGLAPVFSSRPPPMARSCSLLQELIEVDESLNISAIEHPPISSLSNTGIMVSTPMQGASVFSALGVKRPASAFAKVSKAIKKPRLLVPASVQTVSNSVGSKQPNDSGLDKSGVDKRIVWTCPEGGFIWNSYDIH